MRQSNFNHISTRFARGTLFLTAASMLSLHAMAQSGVSEAPKPLPSPIFAATASGTAAAGGDEPGAVATAAAVGQAAAKTAAAASASPVGSPAGQSSNRVSGFAVPVDTADSLTKTPSISIAAKPMAAPTVVPQAAVIAGATSRAGIARLNAARPASKTAPHPLAEAYPGYDVVVCLAGCGPEPKAVSIYKSKHTVDYSNTSGGMGGGLIQVAMTTPGSTPECLAGCYDVAPTRSRTIEPSNAAAAVPSPGSPIGATDRSMMVQTSASAPAGPVHLKSKPKAAKKPGSEWFTRRFERKQQHTN
jgi:hypothetical protein